MSQGTISNELGVLIHQNWMFNAAEIFVKAFIWLKAKSMPTFSYTVPQFSSPQTPGCLRLQFETRTLGSSGCAKRRRDHIQEESSNGSTNLIQKKPPGCHVFKGTFMFKENSVHINSQNCSSTLWRQLLNDRLSWPTSPYKCICLVEGLDSSWLGCRSGSATETPLTRYWKC